MVKSYLRYERETSFGVIASTEGNVIFDQTGRFAIASALQEIVVWNIRQGNKVRQLASSDSSEAASSNGQVTCLRLSPDGQLVAAGYSSGLINVFKVATGALEITLDGHKSAVECLVFNAAGALLASGSRDTDIIVWDVEAQTGLYRLRGHKDAVTQLKFLRVGEHKEEDLLVSSSKDSLLKVWELSTQHCVQTCVGHRNEIWSFDIDPTNHSRLITGASDNQLRLWRCDQQPQQSTNQIAEKDESTVPEVVRSLGAVTRQTNDRAMSVQFNPNGQLVGVQSSGKVVEIYRMRTQEEIKKKRQRKEKRQREKQRKKQQQQQGEDGEDHQQQQDEPERAQKGVKEDLSNSAQDELELLCVVRSAHKIRSFAFSPDIAKDGTTSILLGLQNNSIETYVLRPQVEDMESRFAKAHALTLHGHRSDVRAVHISSDDQLLLTLSSTAVKIWNAKSMQCIRTLSEDISSALCAMFAPGNMHVIVGTKNGALLLFDLNSGECIWKDLETHHGAAIWSMDVRPDGKGIATGGADQHVNFWDFEMVPITNDLEVEGTTAGPTTSGLRLGLTHSRLLKMTDDVLCVKFSNTKDPKKLLIAVSLLDFTVKVFHDDSLKFFLSLYGHKLPVISMDISSDDSLLATASADKNVKLWGLDFGDCHKSIFAHQDSIMCVRFVQKTHYFFTASKDKTVCYWDGDHFERILKLANDHFGQVWGVAVSKDGSFMVSCSQDRSICKYVRTEDQVFIEEEKEKEMEQLFEQELTATGNNKKPALNGEQAEDTEESASATKQTVESVRAGERLMEAIELADHEVKAVEEFEQKRAKVTDPKRKEEMTHSPNILLLGFTPNKYVLHTLRKIPSDKMQEALIVLPYEFVKRLIAYLFKLISCHLEVEFCCQILLIALRLHHTQIVADDSLLTEMQLLWESLRTQMVENKNRIGFNLAGLKYLKRQIDEEHTGFVQEIAPTTAAGAAASSSKKKKQRTT